MYIEHLLDESASISVGGTSNSGGAGCSIPVHPAKLSLNYLPPTKPYQPPADSYLPPPANSYLPPPSNSYLPPSFARRSGNVEDNLVEDVEPEEAGVEEGPAEAAVVAEVAPETPNETEALWKKRWLKMLP